jgi:hypothetical protein
MVSKGECAIIRNMTKLLKEMLERVETWPESRQEDALEVLKGMEAQDKSALRLTEEQAAEVRRRMAKRDAATIPFENVFKRFRSRG